jgi:hypothetical protein
MEESSLAKKNTEDMKKVYVKRRLTILAALVAIIVIVALVLVLLPSSPMMSPEDSPTTPTKKPPPIYEKTPEPEPEEPDPIVNETPEEPCITVPGFEEIGCLEINEETTLFQAEGMRLRDDNVEDVIDEVEKACRTDYPADRDCIVQTAITESENNWACDWECLEDMASCPSYKTHLAVSVLRKYVPATDTFVGRTDDYDFFMIYKRDPNDNTSWTRPYEPSRLSQKDIEDTETLYNDVYHVGELDKVVIPDIQQVEPGDDFCFEFYSNETCICEVNIGTFSVGDCPSLPADLRGICDDPVDDVSIRKGYNKVCFEVSEDAEDELYTYKFELGGTEDHWFAGNALITTETGSCCVDVTLEGFLEVDD